MLHQRFQCFDSISTLKILEFKKSGCLTSIKSQNRNKNYCALSNFVEISLSSNAFKIDKSEILQKY